MKNEIKVTKKDQKARRNEILTNMYKSEPQS